MSHHILPLLCWILAWEYQDMPATLWWLMWHSNTQQLPSESCSSPPYVMIMSHCSEGHFHYMSSASCRQQAIHCSRSLGVAFSFIRLHVYRSRSELYFHPCVIQMESIVQRALGIVRDLGKMNNCSFSWFDHWHSLVVELVGTRALTAGLKHLQNWQWQVSFRAFHLLIASLANAKYVVWYKPVKWQYTNMLWNSQS